MQRRADGSPSTARGVIAIKTALDPTAPSPIAPPTPIDPIALSANAASPAPTPGVVPRATITTGLGRFAPKVNDASTDPSPPVRSPDATPTAL